RARSPQRNLTIKAVIINSLYAIWSTRNNARFNSKTTHWKSAIEWIISSGALAGMIYAHMVELCGAMRPIEIGHSKNWKNLWIESNSTFVVKTFSSSALVPWVLCIRCLNCMKLTRKMNFVVSHVFREGNQCADGLANIDLSLDRFTI
ncbi:ribonuclease H, partial [Trifolium pratense]